MAGHRLAYRVGVEDVEPRRRCPETTQELLTLMGAGDSGYIVSLGDQQTNGSAAEHSRGTGDEDLHGAKLAPRPRAAPTHLA